MASQSAIVLLIIFVSTCSSDGVDINQDLYLDNDHGQLGMLVPLEPFASVTGHTGLLSSGMTGAALLNFKAAAVLAFYLALRRGNKGRYYRINKLRLGWGANKRRQRRSAPSPSSVDMETIDNCADLLLCELYNKQSLEEDEQIVLALFGPDHPQAMAKDCSRFKEICSVKSSEIMERLRKFEI